MPSNVLVSGLSDAQYNGLYVYDGNTNGKPSYKFGSNIIYWDTASWLLGDGYFNTSSDSDVAYPWLATGWYTEGIDPAGLVLTETSDNTIFDLQPSVAAEIIKRHGSVKRFLRLRNLGYF